MRTEYGLCLPIYLRHPQLCTMTLLRTAQTLVSQRLGEVALDPAASSIPAATASLYNRTRSACRRHWWRGGTSVVHSLWHEHERRRRVAIYGRQKYRRRRLRR